MKKLIVAILLSTTVVAGSVGVAEAADCADSMADAADCTTEVKGTTLDAPAPAPEAVPAAPKVEAKATLPVTGAESIYLAGAGLPLILGGGLMVIKSRRETETA